MGKAYYFHPIRGLSRFGFGLYTKSLVIFEGLVGVIKCPTLHSIVGLLPNFGDLRYRVIKSVSIRETTQLLKIVQIIAPKPLHSNTEL